MLVVAVTVCPPVLLPIAALLQLSMAGRAPPVALNARAGLAQVHFFELAFSGLAVLWVQVVCHGVAIVAAVRPVSGCLRKAVSAINSFINPKIFGWLTQVFYGCAKYNLCKLFSHKISLQPNKYGRKQLLN